MGTLSPAVNFSRIHVTLRKFPFPFFEDDRYKFASSFGTQLIVLFMFYSIIIVKDMVTEKETRMNVSWQISHTHLGIDLFTRPVAKQHKSDKPPKWMANKCSFLTVIWILLTLLRNIVLLVKQTSNHACGNDWLILLDACMVVLDPSFTTVLK